MAAILRGGKLLAGDKALIGPIADRGCVTVAMAGRTKLLCLSADAGKSYTALKAKADAAKLWPAFFIGRPPIEPTCKAMG